MVPAGTPLDIVFTGAQDDVLADHLLHDGGRLHEDEWLSGPADLAHDGLAPGTYEWECWMGPQCHHGTVVVQ